MLSGHVQNCPGINFVNNNMTTYWLLDVLLQYQQQVRDYLH